MPQPAPDGKFFAYGKSEAWMNEEIGVRKKGKSLLTDENLNRRTREVPALTDFVLEEALVGLFDILRQVGVEDERRYLRVRQL